MKIPATIAADVEYMQLYCNLCAVYNSSPAPLQEKIAVLCLLLVASLREAELFEPLSKFADWLESTEL